MEKKGNFKGADYGFELSKFNAEKELKTTQHKKLLMQLGKNVVLRAKDVRRFSIAAVESEIVNQCLKIQQHVEQDLNSVRLLAKQSLKKTQAKRNNLNKAEMIKHHKDLHFQENHEKVLQKMFTEMNKKLRKNEAKIELLDINLKQLEYEISDWIYEKNAGEKPIKRWYDY